MKWFRSVFKLPPEIQVDLSFHLVEIAITYILRSTSIIPYKPNLLGTNKTCNNLNQSTHG